SDRHRAHGVDVRLAATAHEGDQAGELATLDVALHHPVHEAKPRRREASGAHASTVPAAGCTRRGARHRLRPVYGVAGELVTGGRSPPGAAPAPSPWSRWSR